MCLYIYIYKNEIDVNSFRINACAVIGSMASHAGAINRSFSHISHDKMHAVFFLLKERAINDENKFTYRIHRLWTRFSVYIHKFSLPNESPVINFPNNFSVYGVDSILIYMHEFVLPIFSISPLYPHDINRKNIFTFLSI